MDLRTLMKLTGTLFTLVTLLVACEQATADNGSPDVLSKQNRVGVAVDVNVMDILNEGTANGAKLGINTNYWWDANANRSGGRSLPEALRDANTKYWRYPGGEKGDGYLWSTPPYSAPNPRLARISSEDWPSSDPAYWTPPGDPNGTWAHPIWDFDEFMAACQAADCEPVIVVAYDGIYKPVNPGGTSLTRQQALDMATAWVRYANVTKRYNVKYWEVGNETYKHDGGTLCTYMGCDPGRVTQAQDFEEFARAMKAVDPSIKIGIKTEEQADWDTLLAGAVAQIDFLSVHTYPAYIYESFASYQADSVNATGNVDKAWSALQAYPNDRDRIKLMVTETGPQTYGVNGNWTDNDLGHALVTFDILGKFLSDRRVQFTQVWSTRFVPGSLPEYDFLGADNRFLPTGQALNIAGDYTLERMVSARSTNARIVSFASHDPATGKLNLFLINKNGGSTTVKVNLRGYTAAGSATVSALRGTASTDLNPTFAALGSVNTSGGSLTLKLNPTSLTVVQLNRL